MAPVKWNADGKGAAIVRDRVGADQKIVRLLGLSLVKDVRRKTGLVPRRLSSAALFQARFAANPPS
jgi:hypothetical protein